MDRIKKKSLKNILVRWNLIFITVTVLTSVISISFLTRDSVHNVALLDIQSLYSDLRRSLEIEDDRIIVTEEFENDFEGFSFAVYDSDGRLILGAPPQDFSPDQYPVSGNTRITKRVKIGGSWFYLALGKTIARGDDKQKKPVLLICFIEPHIAYRAYRLFLFSVIGLIFGTALLYFLVVSSLSRQFSGSLEHLMTRVRRIGNSLGEPLSPPAEDTISFQELEEISSAYDRVLQQMNQVLKRERQFNNYISHELRTPIAVISAQSQLTMEIFRNNPDIQDHMKRILKQCDQMGDLVNSLLDLAHLESSGQQPEDHEVALQDVVLAICEREEELAGKTLFVLPLSPVSIFANTDLISTVVRNLISNAVKYGGGKPAEVSLAQEGALAVLKIRDYGNGIAAEDLEKIFEPFYRADPSRSTAGTGLGLTLAKRITEYYHGTITVKSNPGEGSCFCLTFPVYNETGL